jgi:hypothetical protein
MTPKQKAKDLVDKYRIKVSVFFTEDSIPRIVNAEIILKSAKQCALIAVDECINIHFNLESDRNGIGESFKYWQEVKQEIINL